MDLTFNTNIASKYKSPTQIARVLTENWVNTNIYCPYCGNDQLENLPNNSPVADFRCPSCISEYELKSQKDKLSNKIVDGAYDTMVKRINADNRPHFFLLNHKNSQVTNFFVIPKHFFIDEIIEKRKPLGPQARRSGWTGCNILLQGIPDSGKIYYITI